MVGERSEPQDSVNTSMSVKIPPDVREKIAIYMGRRIHRYSSRATHADILILNVAEKTLCSFLLLHETSFRYFNIMEK